jgi:hypothetical protein
MADGLNGKGRSRAGAVCLENGKLDKRNNVRAGGTWDY